MENWLEARALKSHAIFQNLFFDRFYSPENEKVRQEVNAWIRNNGEFDG